jgi:hypothetical protein
MNIRNLLRYSLLLAMFFVSSPHSSSAQTSASAAQATANKQFDVDASKQWLDTNVDLHASEKIKLTATGTVTYPPSASSKSQNSQSFGPDGLGRSFRDLIRQYPVADAGHGALIGRLGSGDAAQPFLIGADKEFTAPVAGRLFLGINQSLSDVSIAQGSFHVTMEVLEQGLTTAAGIAIGGPAETNIPGITPALLNEIPRRVKDPQGNPGDMVNILFLGTQDQVVAAFKAAGWVQVDSSVENTVLSGLMASLSKESYLTMPMSTLYLFNRPQDYGFAHAEPVRVVMSRNHLRVWKSPETIGGAPVWCVAATHDIGFDRDQRNNGITHKIDPDIDLEREYVNGTLSGTGLVTARSHVTPSDPLTEAKTATGGSFHSDGRILVLVLGGAPASTASAAPTSPPASPRLDNSQPLLGH